MEPEKESPEFRDPDRNDRQDPVDPDLAHDSDSDDPDPADPDLDHDPDSDDPDPADHEPDDPVPYPIDGILDLHTFRPSDLGTLIDEWIDECRRRGILNIRIIHGKGTGALRKSVHHLLGRNRYVETYATDGRSGGGATVATLN